MAYSLNPLLKLLFQKDTSVSDLPGVNVTPDEINTLEGINTDSTIQQQINKLQNFADISVSNWTEFIAAVESSQITPCRIHFTANITVDSPATLNLSNCYIYGHYHRWIVDGNMVTLTGNFAYFYDVLFQGAANSSTSTIAFSFVGTASTSCNFAFENCRFYNFLETASNNVFIRVDGATGASIHTFLIRCVINGESNQTSSRALALRKYSGAAVSLKVCELLFSGKPIETRNLSMIGASGSQDMFVADGSCDYVGTRPTNFFQWGNLDPADFATATQGTKADTALQGINNGTDGDYVTTTVTPKDANNAQTVSVELTVQPLATADNDHKGLAESSDVIAYINNLQSQINLLSANIPDVATFQAAVPTTATEIVFAYYGSVDLTGYTKSGTVGKGIVVYADGTKYAVVSAKIIYAPENSADFFLEYSALTTLDLSNFDTSNVTNMFGMFWGCKALTSLDLSNFDTSNVTHIGYMFRGCKALTSLDLSNFDTSNVEGMGGMFFRCEALTSLDLSNFDTSNVEDMGGMFCGCEALTSLDLSNFDTSNVVGTEVMFSGCTALTTIIANNWSAIVNSDDMFDGCTSLVGGNGTTYDASHVDATYAHIDVAGNPGYFTAPS
jgi:surface protein